MAQVRDFVEASAHFCCKVLTIAPLRCFTCFIDNSLCMSRRCPTQPPIPPSGALNPASRGRFHAPASGQATIEFVAVVPLLAIGGAMVLQGLVIAISLLAAQVSAESLTTQAAAGVPQPSLAHAPIDAHMRHRLHLRVSHGRVEVEPPRLLPMPRLHLTRDIVAGSA